MVQVPKLSIALGKMFRIGPRMIPVSMRKMKMGMPVFLKKNSPAKPMMIIPATTAKTTDASIFSTPLISDIFGYFCFANCTMPKAVNSGTLPVILLPEKLRQER